MSATPKAWARASVFLRKKGQPKVRQPSANWVIRATFYIVTYAASLLMARQLTIVVVTLPMLGAILLCNRWSNPRMVGYLDITSLVFFLFFAVVPLQQVQDNIFVWGELRLGRSYPTSWFFQIQILSIFFYFCLSWASIAAERIKPTELTAPVSCASFAAVIAIIAFLGVVLAEGSIKNLLLSRYNKDEDLISPFEFLPVALLSISVSLYFLSSGRKTVTRWVVGSFLCFLMLIALNPLNTARFYLAGTWIPVVLIIFPILLRPLWFYLSATTAFLVLLPVLNVTTRVGLSANRQGLESLYGGGSIFLLKNLNVFEMACEVLRYVERHGYTQGSNMLFTITGLVPRAWWPSKPVTSSLLVGYDQYSSFQDVNLSIPWFMEGYMDFGIVGSICYSAIAAYAFYRLSKACNFTMNGIPLYVFVYLANFTILLRGTLGIVFILFLSQVLFLLLFRLLFFARSKLPARAHGRRTPKLIRMDRVQGGEQRL